MVLKQLLGVRNIYLCTKAPCGVCLGRVTASHLALTKDLAYMAHQQVQHSSSDYGGFTIQCSLSTMCQSICHNLFRVSSLSHMYNLSLWLFFVA